VAAQAGRPRDGGEVLAQRLHERLIGDAEVLVAPTRQHRRAGGVDPAGQLGRQAGLADARLPGQQGESALAGGGLLPHLAKPLELGVPADEDPPDGGDERREGQLVGPGLGLPAHLADGHRGGQPLELHRLQIGKPGLGPAAAPTASAADPNVARRPSPVF
jgi:hypothetical protein